MKRRLVTPLALLLSLAFCSPAIAGKMKAFGFGFSNYLGVSGIGTIYDESTTTGTAHAGTVVSPNGLTVSYDAYPGTGVDDPSVVAVVDTKLHISVSGTNSGPGAAIVGARVAGSYAAFYELDIGQTTTDMTHQQASGFLSGYAAAGDTISFQLQAYGNQIGGPLLSQTITGPGPFSLNQPLLIVHRPAEVIPTTYNGGLYMSISITRAPGGGPGSGMSGADPTESYVDITQVSAGSGLVPEPSTLLLLAIGAISLLGYRKAKSHG